MKKSFDHFRSISYSTFASVPFAVIMITCNLCHGHTVLNRYEKCHALRLLTHYFPLLCWAITGVRDSSTAAALLRSIATGSGRHEGKEVPEQLRSKCPPLSVCGAVAPAEETTSQALDRLRIPAPSEDPSYDWLQFRYEGSSPPMRLNSIQDSEPRANPYWPPYSNELDTSTF